MVLVFGQAVFVAESPSRAERQLRSGTPHRGPVSEEADKSKILVPFECPGPQRGRLLTTNHKLEVAIRAHRVDAAWPSATPRSGHRSALNFTPQSWGGKHTQPEENGDKS